MQVIVKITRYQITKMFNTPIKSLKNEFKLRYLFNGLSYTEQDRNYYEKGFDYKNKEFYENILNNKSDFIKIDHDMLNLSNFKFYIQVIEQFCEKYNIEYYLKWEIVNKKLTNSQKSISILDGHIDLALHILNNSVNEVIYFYADNFNQLIEKMFNFRGKLQFISEFSPIKNMNLKGENVLLSELASGIFIHEVVGHLSESDLLVGKQNLINDLINKKINNELTVIDDGSIMSSGWTPVDDELTNSEKTTLIKSGKWHKFLHSNYTSELFNTHSTGNCRISYPEFKPQVRMTNLVIDKGSTDLDLLLKKNDKFIFIDSFSTCYGFRKIHIVPNRSYYYQNGNLEPVRINELIIDAYDILGKIIYVGNKDDIIQSTLTGCKKFSKITLPVSIRSPKLFFESFIS
ncbi:metallopeptidase TldD-related protein [uncultured Anaerococcus sp.]|mgnify:CR=1 FL=1|uniref:metallopeptidase TldD-related protein n=1 Tax=uncultured Anaerococcus sp. TaxID=293428 RepID=UPI00260D1D30|nr:metallopeptidase TldD-related protein [uncultured Anaerococcus sp.]